VATIFIFFLSQSAFERYHCLYTYNNIPIYCYYH